MVNELISFLPLLLDLSVSKCLIATHDWGIERPRLTKHWAWRYERVGGENGKHSIHSIAKKADWNVWVQMTSCMPKCKWATYQRPWDSAVEYAVFDGTLEEKRLNSRYFSERQNSTCLTLCCPIPGRYSLWEDDRCLQRLISLYVTCLFLRIPLKSKAMFVSKSVEYVFEEVWNGEEWSRVE